MVQPGAGSGAAGEAGGDDRASFVKLSLAVVCRSVVFFGLSTFVSLYAKERLGGSTAAGTAALFVLYPGGAMGSVLGGAPAERWGRVAVSRWSSSARSWRSRAWCSYRGRPCTCAWR